jgi:hypothetical protein
MYSTETYIIILWRQLRYTSANCVIGTRFLQSFKIIGGGGLGPPSPPLVSTTD